MILATTDAVATDAMRVITTLIALPTIVLEDGHSACLLNMRFSHWGAARIELASEPALLPWDAKLYFWVHFRWQPRRPAPKKGAGDVARPHALGLYPEQQPD